MNTAGTKSLIAVFVGVLAYIRQGFNELFAVLVILLVSDYILGTIVAFVNGEFNIEKGIKGAIKKTSYIFLLVLAFLLDYTIVYLTEKMGIALPVKGMFGFAVMCYLIGTEGISNIKSLAMLGLPIPEFLKKGFGMIKDASDITK